MSEKIKSIELHRHKKIDVYNSFMNRRHMLKLTGMSALQIILFQGAILTSISSHGRGESDAISNFYRILDNINLETTIGSLVGAALDSTFYALKVAMAPIQLIESFISSIRGGGSRKNAANSYLDYRMSEEEKPNTVVGQQRIVLDVRVDTSVSSVISDEVNRQIKLVNQINNDSKKTFFEVREILREIRKEVNILSLEMQRSANSVEVSKEVSHKVKNSSIDPKGQLSKEIGIANEKDKLKSEHCRMLQQIVSGYG